MSSGFSRITISFAVVCSIILIISGCKKGPRDSELIVPGVRAGNIMIGVDDSATVTSKLGTPDNIVQLRPAGAVWLYSKKGIGVQFKGDMTLYSDIAHPDSTVTKILLLRTQMINDQHVESSTMQTAQGLSVESSPHDFIHTLGEPIWIQMPVGMVVDDPNFAGSLFYPGMTVNYNIGKVHSITLDYSPVADSTGVAKFDSQPIEAGQSLGGIKLGMTTDQIQQLLGPTKFQYSKLTAQFWLYPQYALKIQFGIPPVEGMRSSQFIDTQYIGKVTGVTGLPKNFFEKKLCFVQYQGKTPQGLGVGSAFSDVQEKLGSPDSVKTNPADMLRMAEYPGIVFFIDMRTQSVDHILVKNPDLPVDIPSQRN